MPAVTVEDILVLPRVPEPDAATAAGRPVVSVTTAPSGFEGEGFPVRRAFAGVDLAKLDPFIHMDQMGEVEYAPGEPKGTPWHPHRGFETVTYIIDGVFRHQDSNGGGGLITNGDTQWMTAGGGILHIEEPPEELVMSGGLFHGFQLWVNLPRSLKMTAPRYQDIRAQQVSLLSSPEGGALIRVSPATWPATPARASRTRRRPAPCDPAARRPAAPALAQRLQRAGRRAGWLRHGRPGAPAGPHRALAVFGAGDALTVGAARTQEGPGHELDILVLGGQPIREPVAAYGPFVMNTREELVQAFEDFQAGRLGSIPAQRAEVPAEPHPGHDVL